MNTAEEWLKVTRFLGNFETAEDVAGFVRQIQAEALREAAEIARLELSALKPDSDLEYTAARVVRQIQYKADETKKG
jgi:hypothetical protein